MRHTHTYQIIYATLSDTFFIIILLSNAYFQIAVTLKSIWTLKSYINM